MKRQFLETDVLRIREVYASGVSLRRIAEFWDAHRKVILDIVRGRTYKNVGGPVSNPARLCPECGQTIRAQVTSRARND